MIENGNIVSIVVSFSNITQQKENEELIWHQANYDALTGLPNRRLFQEHLLQETQKAERTHQLLALLLLDIDHFKEVNDTLGHDMGDTLLQEAAQRIKNCVRETDTVARLGGDEFTVILSGALSSYDVDLITQKILHALARPFQLGKVIAEGVETQSQLELLQSIDCDYAQGYLFSRPIPTNEFEQLLLANLDKPLTGN
ncbi:MAG: GGDEF domain-containing protein [Gammaproteobacteria bacterium]|nr:GGDEF domain-containing protein [Gammaproteobacteria bacterium]